MKCKEELSFTSLPNFVYIMAFRNDSIHTVSFIGFVVYIVIIPVDNSGLKSQRNKKRKDTFINV